MDFRGLERPLGPRPVQEPLSLSQFRSPLAQPPSMGLRPHALSPALETFLTSPFSIPSPAAAAAASFLNSNFILLDHCDLQSCSWSGLSHTM